MKRFVFGVIFIACLGLIFIGCSKTGKKLSVVFKGNPQISDHASVFYNDYKIGEVLSNALDQQANSVNLNILIYQKYIEQIDGQMVFYRKTSLLGKNKGSDLYIFKCTSRDQAIPLEMLFEGHYGHLAAQGECLLDNVGDFLAEVVDSAEQYWASDEGKTDRKKIKKFFEQAKVEGKETWESLQTYSEEVAEKMREKGWDKEAQKFLDEMKRKIKEATQ